MPFENYQEVETRLLANPSRLTEQEIRDLIPFIRAITGGALQRLHVELSLQNIEAIQKFERSSSKLSSRISWLTYVLVFLTIVIAISTGFMVFLQYENSALKKYEKEPISVEVVAEPIDEMPEQEVMEESKNPEVEAKDKPQAAPPKENPKPVE